MSRTATRPPRTALARPRRTALARGAALALAGALLLTACSAAAEDDAAQDPLAQPGTTTDGGSASEPGDDGASSDGSASDPAPATDGPLAFTAATVSGGELDVSTLAGEPVVLWFWAPWCTICRNEAPDVSEVVAELDGEVTFLGVAGLGPVADMQGFVTDTDTGGFEHLADTDGSLWGRFAVSSQPAFAFVAPDGSVEVVSGALGADGLRERATALIDG